jgi:hypothetical protein
MKCEFERAEDARLKKKKEKRAANKVSPVWGENK